jgi:hypothetical protein
MVEYTIVVEPAAAQIVQRIFELRNEGSSLRAIAKTLNQEQIPTPQRGTTWGPSSVREILGNEDYYRGNEGWPLLLSIESSPAEQPLAERLLAEQPAEHLPAEQPLAEQAIPPVDAPSHENNDPPVPPSHSSHIWDSFSEETRQKIVRLWVELLDRHLKAQRAAQQESAEESRNDADTDGV